MKNEQREQAKNLYFQTELSKSQIATLLNISRTTLHTWVVDGNWDRLKNSATHLPALIAEKCYYIIGNYTDHLLSEQRESTPLQKQEADTLYRMVVILNKLKNRSTINESMEMFGFFFDGLKAKAPRLATDLLPHLEEYMSSRAAVYPEHLAPESLNERGRLPVKEKNYTEEELDQQDLAAWQQEQEQGMRAAGSTNAADKFRSAKTDTVIAA